MNETHAQLVTRCHQTAMRYYDEARVARLHGNRAEQLRYTILAFEKEREAADLMIDRHVEPTRSVLHRSAASLAWQCQMYDEAKALIHRGLEGNPPGDIKRELNELLEMVEAALEDSALAPVPQPEPATAP